VSESEAMVQPSSQKKVVVGALLLLLHVFAVAGAPGSSPGSFDDRRVGLAVDAQGQITEEDTNFEKHTHALGEDTRALREYSMAARQDDKPTPEQEKEMLELMANLTKAEERYNEVNANLTRVTQEYEDMTALVMATFGHKKAPSGTEAADVSCGNNRAATCAECPQGHGAGWCNGDCAWVSEQCVRQATPPSLAEVSTHLMGQATPPSLAEVSTKLMGQATPPSLAEVSTHLMGQAKVAESKKPTHQRLKELMEEKAEVEAAVAEAQKEWEVVSVRLQKVAKEYVGVLGAVQAKFANKTSKVAHASHASVASKPMVREDEH